MAAKKRNNSAQLKWQCQKYQRLMKAAASYGGVMAKIASIGEKCWQYNGGVSNNRHEENRNEINMARSIALSFLARIVAPSRHAASRAWLACTRQYEKNNRRKSAEENQRENSRMARRDRRASRNDGARATCAATARRRLYQALSSYALLGRRMALVACATHRVNVARGAPAYQTARCCASRTLALFLYACAARHHLGSKHENSIALRRGVIVALASAA